MNPLSRIAVLLVLAWSVAHPVMAQPYPSKLIRIIIPSPPGGVTDVVARIAADYMSNTIGQRVVGENRTGAAGNVGMDVVAKADPDGYTLALGITGNFINAFVYKQMPFDVLKDFVPVSPIGEAPQILIVNANMPAKSLKEFIALAKSQPGKFSYGSAGSGSTAHLGANQFVRLAGLELLHVPYRGVGPAVTDLVNGTIQMVSLSAGPVIGFVRAGKLRFLAVASKQRLPQFPDLPTSQEAGLPEYEMSTWFGLFAPRGTPGTIVEQLNRNVRAMVKDPVAKKRLEDYFLTPMDMSATEFSEFVHAEYKKWGRVVRESGIQPE